MNPKANQGKLSIPLQEKMTRLSRILQEMESVVVAFSGGVDSTLLLYVAHKELGRSRGCFGGFFSDLSGL